MSTINPKKRAKSFQDPTKFPDDIPWSKPGANPPKPTKTLKSSNIASNTPPPNRST